jgi:two-component sensor histidine kinase
LKLAKKYHWNYAIQYCHTNLAEFYFYTQQTEKSKKLLDQVVTNRKKTELRDLFQVYSILEYYFQDQNNKDSAYYFATKKNEIDDILEQEQSDDLANELDKDFQSEKQKLMLNKEIKENNYLRILFVLIAALVIISVIIGFFFIRQKSKSNHQLLQQKDEINEKNKIISIALSEKETLLKEIHHRVKNNLQVVSSILNLQSRNIKDEEALRIIEEGKERIFAISLIHNQLYLNKDVAFVELGAYLEKLIHQMNTSFSTNKNIHVITEIDEIELAIDTAVPVGLILCELLSNAYKHAFKDLANGEIHIELKKLVEDQSTVQLKIWDNGIGYTGENEFLDQSSTGVEIITSFIEQLNATYSYLTLQKGFGILITFSTKEN